jgi:hypothetical protein
MRFLRVIDEKLDVVISGHGERLQKLEAGHADHEARLTTIEQAVKWLSGKLTGRKP